MSLRRLLVIVGLIALALASLCDANDSWQILILGFTMIVVFATAIIAVVDRGAGQAFAIGFTLIVAAYGLLLMGRAAEFDQYSGRWPTTHLLKFLHGAMDRSEWVDTSTGSVIKDFDPQHPSVPIAGGGSFGVGPTASWREVPPREAFMPIGHCWWALLLGFAGGNFAQYVYLRRIRKQARTGG
jgi:hypothetical protein